MKGKILAIACATMLIGCNNDDAANNGTANNTTSGTNNTAGGTNNTTGANNTTSGTNNTTGATNNTTGATNNAMPPMAADLSCDIADFPAPDPSGNLDDLLGDFDGLDACVGERPYTFMRELCGELVLSAVETIDTGNYVRITPDHRIIHAQFKNGTVESWWPPTCVDEVGAGDCSAVGAALDAHIVAHAGEGTTTCVDDPGGACLCTFEGFVANFDAALLTQTGDGTATRSYFDAAGTVVAEDYVFAPAIPEGFVLRSADGTSRYYSGSPTGDSVSLGSFYCAGFLSNCNGIAGVDGYASYDACITAALAMPSAGGDQATGDSIECRYHHLLLSLDTSDATAQATHCPHAQAAPAGVCVN